MSCTNINETQAIFFIIIIYFFCSFAFNILAMLLKHFTYFTPATSYFSASKQWVFLNVSDAANDHGMPWVTPRPLLDPVCGSVL